MTDQRDPDARLAASEAEGQAQRDRATVQWVQALLDSWWARPMQPRECARMRDELQAALASSCVDPAATS
jgi:hypothetical protein